MSIARQCDACGELSPALSAIQLSVSVPFDSDSGEDGISYHTWEVDVCASCLDRPLRAVLEDACNEVELPAVDRGGGESYPVVTVDDAEEGSAP